MTTDWDAQLIGRVANQFTLRPRFTALIRSLASPASPLEQAVLDVAAERQLTTAAGEQLERLGRLYRETREGETDTVYRARLQAMAIVVASTGTANDMLETAVRLDAGVAPASVTLTPNYPAGFVMTARVPLGERAKGVRMARILRRVVAAGVVWQLHYEELGASLFSWSGGIGEGWAEESNPSGTGGIWAEGIQ